MNERSVDLVVISDVHLGTTACRAAELNAYLKSISPSRIILNGDILDLWHVRAGAWTSAQTKVVRRLLKFASQGVEVTYLIGNHDEALRRFAPLSAAMVQVMGELELDLQGQRTWFVHGDIADAQLEASWLTRAGAHAYDMIQAVGDRMNMLRRWCGLKPRSLNASLKHAVPAARRHVARFETTMAHLAAQRGMHAVVCGHVHVPAQREMVCAGRTVHYLNSGDWVDSLSALEWHQGAWSLRHWDDLLAHGQVIAPRVHDPVETVAA